MSFGVRLSILVALLALIAGIDYYRHRGGARKWREYGLLLFGGAIGAAFGAVNDVFVTSLISPEYFIHGKGLAGGDGFTTRVLLLGLQAGIAPGFLGMGVFLFINTRRPELPQLPLSCLGLQMWKPLLAAALFGGLFPLLFGTHDPFDFVEALRSLLDSAQGAAFLRAWWTHLGIYAGCAFGIGWAAVSLHRQRRLLILTSSPSRDREGCDRRGRRQHTAGGLVCIGTAGLLGSLEVTWPDIICS